MSGFVRRGKRVTWRCVVQNGFDRCGCCCLSPNWSRHRDHGTPKNEEKEFPFPIFNICLVFIILYSVFYSYYRLGSWPLPLLAAVPSRCSARDRKSPRLNSGH